jgi:oligoendopeptidase F
MDTGDPTARVAVDEIYGRTETDRSYQILKGVGIDMTQPEPYRAVIVRLNKQLDQIETLLTAK